MLKRKLALAKTLLRLGPRRLLLVAQHRRRLRGGAYKKLTPGRDWSEFGATTLRSPFSLPSAGQLVQVMGEDARAQLIGVADRIVDGELRYFSVHWKRRGPWRANPLTGYETPLVHWTEIRDFDERQGDIKWIWEASRFDWAVTLARAYALTGESKYERTFRDLLQDWRSQNPPNQGINWYCGQECSLRLMALVFAGTVFRSPESQTLISSTVSALAERVEPTMDYAIGQHNNHGTSEATGLYLAGCCLPDHPSAVRWRQQGRRILERLILEQFAVDGSYVQHSFVYQRLALRACLLAALAARRLEDTTLEGRAEDLVSYGVEFLHEVMVAPDLGRLPNYGANDGANALALSEADYLDFRPIIQAGMALMDEQRAFGPGPWDEELAWLGIRTENLKPAESPEPLYVALSGGYARLTEQGFSVFMRVPKYTDGRPGQADALHVDIWHNGSPVAIDSGTYSYNDPDGWSKHFKSTGAHNTVMVDDKDQMPLASRFLYTHWTNADIDMGSDLDEDGMTEFGSIFVRGLGMGGTSHAYEQIGLGIQHQRAIGVSDIGVTIVDVLRGTEGRSAKLLWHLAGKWIEEETRWLRDDGLCLDIQVGEMELNRSTLTDSPPATLVSEAYGETTACTLIEVEFTIKSELAIVSTFSIPAS